MIRAVLRFVRTAVAVGGGAAIAWAIGNAASLPVEPAFAALIGALLAAFDKYARDQGWYRIAPGI